MDTKFISGKSLKTLLGAAVVAVGLLATGAPAHAQPAAPGAGGAPSVAPAAGPGAPGQPAALGGYLIEIDFGALRLQNVDDGVADGTDLEVFGSLSFGAGPGSGGVRNFGTWENPAGCVRDYIFDTSGCAKEVNERQIYDFQGTGLCTSTTYSRCDGPFKLYNEKIRAYIYPGQVFKASVDIRDWDRTSSSDIACQATRFFGPYTPAQLSNLFVYGTMSDTSHDADCSVTFAIRTFK